MSLRSDFRITFEDEDSAVSFESGLSSSFASGPRLVSQKVLHCLFSEPGDLDYDLQWGCGLLNIFKEDGIVNKDGNHNRFISNCLRKAVLDIKRSQPPELPSDSRLADLELISVKKNLRDGSLEVKIKVVLANGQDLELLI